MTRFVPNPAKKSDLVDLESKSNQIQLFGDATVLPSWQNKIVVNRSGFVINLTVPDNLPESFRFRGIGFFGGFEFLSTKNFYYNNSSKSVPDGSNFEFIQDLYYPGDVHLFTELIDPNTPVFLNSGLSIIRPEWNGKLLIASEDTVLEINPFLPSNFKCDFMVTMNGLLDWTLSSFAIIDFSQELMLGGAVKSYGKTFGKLYTRTIIDYSVESRQSTQQIYLAQTFPV